MSISLKNDLTVVIPVYNEIDYIFATLSSLYNQNGVDSLRVIIADGGSTDGTQSYIDFLIKSFYPKLNITRIEGGKVAYGRNEGSKYAITKYVLFLDADSTLPDKNNLLYNVGVMEKKNLDLLTCEVKATKNSSIRVKIAFSIFNIINKIISIQTPFAVGGYFMTSKHKFRDYGKFNEQLNNSEDYWLSKLYNPKKFHISKMKYTQDDRRFKKTGYIGMVKLLIKNYINRNNIEYFKKDVGYWD
jgi:glycosyltransferase involved in cell wall biosynthesis